MSRNLTKSHVIQSAFPSVILLLLIVILLPVNALVPNDPGSPQILSDTSNVCNGQGRTSNCEVELDVPSDCISPDGASSCPIVFFLHGAGGTNNGYSMFSGVHEEGVIGIYPQGEDGWNTGPKSSNDCDWDNYECTTDPDEGSFIAAIIAEVRSLGANGNVYVIGSSNGAALANVLGVNAGEELPIKGFVSLVTQLLASPDRSGPGMLNYCNPAALGGTGPNVSVLNVMGTNDVVIPYEGGSSFVFQGVLEFQLMHALTSMETWAIHNGCNPTPIETPVTTNTVAGGDGTGVFYEYVGCTEGSIVEHYAINGGGHNAGQSTINGVSASYDLAYGFIRRVEESSGPSPTVNPTISNAPTPTSICMDDPDWLGQFSPPVGQPHNCFYVSLQPSFRCNWISTDGIFASEACPVACGTCPPPCEEDPNALIVGLISVENTIFATCNQLSANPQYIDLVCNLDPMSKAELISPSTICPQTCGTTNVEDDPEAEFLALLVQNGEPQIYVFTCQWLAQQSSSILQLACNLDLSVWDDFKASSVCCDTCSSR